MTTARGRARRRWWFMVNRCHNPKSSDWVNYGGRGITVCPEWHEFQTFYDYVGDPPVPGLTLDRIDNNAGYRPGNVRWADRTTQNRNRRFNHWTDRDRCPKGHRYDQDNTYHRPTGGRGCKECRRQAVREHRARQTSLTP